VIAPPATLGVLGGGQLGRYFVIAATTMGFRTMVLEPDPDAPAGSVADVHLVAPYDDSAAVARMGSDCAAVTVEFENPPAATLEELARHTVVRPSAASIAVAQDRIAEKRFLGDHGLPVAPWAPVLDDDLGPATALAGAGPTILKTARLGYDGKGQVALDAGADVAAAWDALGRVACVIEARLPLERELSVVLARSATGAVAVHPVAENTHAGGILDLTVVPAANPGDAAALAVAVAEALDYTGVLAVELFVVGGALVVNELAPRPHNSGHWTLDAARTSQFEQQVRALTGLPLGDPSALVPGVAMANLLGDLWAGGPPRWEAALADPRASLHLYGKREARPGRKMGHLTVTADSPGGAAQTAGALRASTIRR
jgi:5-(carboxyamino)imidazole ribonucleotide synthase